MREQDAEAAPAEPVIEPAPPQPTEEFPAVQEAPPVRPRPPRVDDPITPPSPQVALAHTFRHDESREEQELTELYLRAVRHPSLSRGSLVAAGFVEGHIDVLMEELVARGLVRPGGAPDTWEAIPPDIALPALARQLEHRASQVKAVTRDLARSYRRARARAQQGDDAVTVLGSLQDIQDASESLQSVATQELHGFRDDSPRTAYLFARSLDHHRQRALSEQGRPLTLRTTYDTRILAFARAGDVLLARTEGGEHFRFLHGLPFSLLIADSQAALVDLTSYDSSGQGSLLIHDRRLVLALAALSEMVWTMAAPSAWEGTTALDRRGAFILSLLAAGATDSAIATQTGLSQRTVERRVRSLMDQLGAATRFQAGVLAARRGWL